MELVCPATSPTFNPLTLWLTLCSHHRRGGWWVAEECAWAARSDSSTERNINALHQALFDLHTGVRQVTSPSCHQTQPPASLVPTSCPLLPPLQAVPSA